MIAWFVRDIWHKYHKWYFKIISNFKISLVAFMPNITTNHAITVLIDLYFIFFSIFRKITQCKNQLQENLFIVNAVRLSIQCWSWRHCGTICGIVGYFKDKGRKYNVICQTYKLTWLFKWASNLNKQHVDCM